MIIRMMLKISLGKITKNINENCKISINKDDYKNITNDNKNITENDNSLNK